MAAIANSAHQKRTRPRGLISADISRHHRPEAAHRNGRQQRRSFQVRQTRQISYQIEIGSSFSVQLPFAGFERHNCTDYHQTIASGSCKSLMFHNLIKIKNLCLRTCKILYNIFICYDSINVGIIFLSLKIFIFKICISISLFFSWFSKVQKLLDHLKTQSV